MIISRNQKGKKVQKMDTPDKTVQTTLSQEENERFVQFLRETGGKSKRSWLREKILQEVNEYEHAKRLYEQIPNCEE